MTPSPKTPKPAAKPPAKAPPPKAGGPPRPSPSKPGSLPKGPVPSVPKLPPEKPGPAIPFKKEADKSGREPLCQIEILKDGHFFIARTSTEAGSKEYKNTVFEDMLTEMVITLQEQLQDR